MLNTILTVIAVVFAMRVLVVAVATIVYFSRKVFLKVSTK